MADKIPNTDHHQVCKFEDGFSPGFEMVVKRMQQLVTKLSKPSTRGLSIARGATSINKLRQGVSVTQEEHDGTE